MHPAPSVIFFSTFSGLGFGLMAFLGLGLPDVTGWVAFTFWFIAYACSVGGLLASLFHLANPKNARKALSQWRSSWLSREGIAAIATLLTAAPYAIGRIFFDTAWQPLGYATAALALFTVFTTAMIYTQLRTVPRWNTPFTPALFLAYSLSGGALLAGQPIPAALLLLVTGALQIAYWWQGDAAERDPESTVETATGLGRIGATRLFEPPHQGDNYLLREMAYRIARKHAVKLRALALILGAALPAGLLLVFSATHLVALVAVLSHITGLLAARWLFFAEARHVQSLYYGL
ncbi:dimethyl sulfoxide reductase anchor subunit family protein [Rhodalgimonas zhirmunskyi]|uniref:Dimethyl sulfoxide reductase anchor subunit n=1 Tax=Rhodalgimonas zhirmunskyi TaxID=2964767 RepID=A0AAJ1U516_9RHOB|nr:DmsC/YnfH family molybdoenzyme membrane anchor subunit [Rhodoalgimonas zhirmunskyi]MDQ2093179.1 dimethyl sulfoxide reductase anchor subunit [Rhodoalgimonas zhirmunskyi]